MPQRDGSSFVGNVRDEAMLAYGGERHSDDCRCRIHPVCCRRSVATVCPVCELACDKLVLDAAGTPREAEMCERCHRVTEIMVADVHFLTDPRYNLASLSEAVGPYMRRMHKVLL